MIQAKGIRRKFGQLEVLRGVDLEVGAGEVVSIVVQVALVNLPYFKS